MTHTITLHMPDGVTTGRVTKLELALDGQTLHLPSISDSPAPSYAPEGATLYEEFAQMTLRRIEAEYGVDASIMAREDYDLDLTATEVADGATVAPVPSPRSMAAAGLVAAIAGPGSSAFDEGIQAFRIANRERVAREFCRFAAAEIAKAKAEAKREKRRARNLRNAKGAP